MAVKTVKMSPAEISRLYQRIKPFAVRETKPQYTYWQIRTESGLTVTPYTSGKVVFQGNDLDFLESDGSASPSSETGVSRKNGNREPSLTLSYPMAGSDEVGTGDFFGPIVTAAVIVENEEQARWLKSLHVTDSKAMNDEVIRKTAPLIEEKLCCSVRILSNPAYNDLHQKLGNIKMILAMQHNQAYLDLTEKGCALPGRVIVDQFCAPSSYFTYLKKAGVENIIRNIHFETRAESRYPAVAAASVLARYYFLKCMENLSEKYGIQISKGAGAPADQSGRKLLEQHSPSVLYECAKIHFANMNKIGAGAYKEK